MDTPLQRAVVLAGLLGWLCPCSNAAEPPATSRATLLPARPAPPVVPAPTVRMSGADLDPYFPTGRGPYADDPGSTHGTDTSRSDPPKTYPPTFSGKERSGLFNFGPARQRKTSNKLDTAEPPEANSPAADAKTPTPVATPHSPLVQGTPQAIPSEHTLVSPPAWRWYGWGNTAPSVTGDRHPGATANWMTQSGATAGAFPQGAVPERPTTGGRAAYPQPAFQGEQTIPPPEASPYLPVRSGAPDAVSSAPIQRTSARPSLDVPRPAQPRATLGTPVPVEAGPSADLLLPPIEIGPAQTIGWPSLAAPRPGSQGGGVGGPAR